MKHILASLKSGSARRAETFRQSAVIALRMLVGAPVWLLFGFVWWIRRAWRDLLDDAAWGEE